MLMSSRSQQFLEHSVIITQRNDGQSYENKIKVVINLLNPLKVFSVGWKHVLSVFKQPVFFSKAAKSSSHMKEHLRPRGRGERQSLRATAAFHRKAESVNGNESKPHQGNKPSGWLWQSEKVSGEKVDAPAHYSRMAYLTWNQPLIRRKSFLVFSTRTASLQVGEKQLRDCRAVLPLSHDCKHPTLAAFAARALHSP